MKKVTFIIAMFISMTVFANDVKTIKTSETKGITEETVKEGFEKAIKQMKKDTRTATITAEMIEGYYQEGIKRIK